MFVGRCGLSGGRRAMPDADVRRMLSYGKVGDVGSEPKTLDAL